MTYELHMSGVVTGSLNCFCLACDVFLQSARDATHHVRTSQHQNKAGAVLFSDKFPDEHIKKFKRGYYCEFCNVLMPIASKVKVHVNEDEHKHNKEVLLLKPLGLDVVAFNNVLIEEKAWHGLIEGVCSLCNAEFEDEDDHKSAAEHSLNLVLKPIQFGADNAIFRPLDDTAVQCLTCNKLLAISRVSKHFVDAEHFELYAKRRIDDNVACPGTESKENCQEKANGMASVTEYGDEMKSSKIDNDVYTKNKREDKNNNEKRSTKDKSKILESIAKYQTKGININLETETIFCKKCSEVLTFDFDEIKNHIDNHPSAAEVNSDLLYPSHLDQHLNRVDINDKTTQSSDDQQNEVKDNLKAPRSNVQNYALTEKDCEFVSADYWDDPPTENFKKDIQEEEIRDFAKVNNITYNNNKSFCRICEAHLPVSFKSMKEHVEGTNHRRLVASSKPSTTQPKTPGNISKHDSNNRVDINNKTTRSSDDQQNEVKDTLKDLRTNVQNDSSNNEDYETISTCSVDDFDNPPTEKFENDIQEEEIRDFAKANKITFNRKNKKSFCRICEVHLPAYSFKSMKEHVEGTNHRRLVASSKSSTTQPKTPGNLSKQATIEFLDTAIHIRTFLYVASMVNEKYCILKNSLYLVLENDSRMMCFVCDMNLPPHSDVDDHANSTQHLERWKKVPVITSERNELIREVRPGLYHCGFCHLLVSGWTDMKRHLECSEHRRRKSFWECQLIMHLPGVQQEIGRQRLMRTFSMMRMFNMFFTGVFE